MFLFTGKKSIGQTSQNRHPMRLQKRAQLRRRMRRLLFEGLEERALLATVTWDGGGTNDNWSMAANWVGNVAPANGDSLVFDTATPGVARFMNNNDLSGLSLGSISINDTSPTSNFRLDGNGITLNGGLTVSGYASIELNNILLGADQTFLTSGDPFGVTLDMFAAIDTNGTTLNVTGTGYQNYYAVISGSGGLHFTANAYLHAANTYSGLTHVTGYRVVLQSAGTLGATSSGTIVSNATVQLGQRVPD